MGLFKRKKKTEPVVVTTTTSAAVPMHQCIMKDMPWYLEYIYSDRAQTFSYKIVEPFICISGCGKRINKILEQNSFSGVPKKWRDNFLNHLQEAYKDYLKPKAIVEDMINDIFLVKDPAHLEMVEKLRGLPHQGCGSSSKMKPKSNYRITMENKDGNN